MQLAAQADEAERRIKFEQMRAEGAGRDEDDQVEWNATDSLPLAPFAVSPFSLSSFAVSPFAVSLFAVSSFLTVIILTVIILLFVAVAVRLLLMDCGAGGAVPRAAGCVFGCNGRYGIVEGENERFSRCRAHRCLQPSQAVMVSQSVSQLPMVTHSLAELLANRKAD